MALNVSRLLNHSQKADRFIDNLEVAPHRKDVIQEAAKIIKAHLRQTIPVWLTHNLQAEANVTPRFMTQGSFAYNTANEPCHFPPQEVDRDIGIYLPVNHWEENTRSPKHAARTYFRMVEEVMHPLSKEKGWTLSRKERCVRVLLNHGSSAHIDLPLYAAPLKDFETITETVAKSRTASMSMSLDSAFSEQEWDNLDSIVLACENGEWSKSDPREVIRWFRQCRTRLGDERLVRVCRYLKAWRDHHWKTGGPSSILLMVSACQTLENIIDLPSRDDLMLKAVCAELPQQLRGDVCERRIGDGENLNRMSEPERVHASSLAAKLSHALNMVMDQMNLHEKEQANLALCAVFGERLPFLPHEIEQCNQQVAIIRQQPAKVVSAPQVQKTHAG